MSTLASDSATALESGATVEAGTTVMPGPMTCSPRALSSSVQPLVMALAKPEYLSRTSGARLPWVCSVTVWVTLYEAEWAAMPPSAGAADSAATATMAV